MSPESVNTGDDDDDGQDDLKMPKYATQSAWVEGKKMMKKINYVLVYAAQTARQYSKRTVGRFIVSCVREMQTGNHTIICEEAIDPLPSSWSTPIQNLNPNVYKKYKCIHDLMFMQIQLLSISEAKIKLSLLLWGSVISLTHHSK